MNNKGGILAVYRYLDDVTMAIEKMHGRPEFADHEVYTPTSYHEIDHAEHLPPSPIRWFTLAGGLTGVCTGFGLALFIDWDWPLVVGGKTPGLYSLPPYVVIGFELTILFGALMTILGMLIHCRIPNPTARILNARTTDDRFAIFVPGATVESSQAKLLRDCGAEEITAIS